MLPFPKRDIEKHLLPAILLMRPLCSHGIIKWLTFQACCRSSKLTRSGPHTSMTSYANMLYIDEAHGKTVAAESC